MIVPHASYFFSGAIASSVYSEIASRNVKTMVLLGPNHNGIGQDVAISDHDVWKSPLGTINVDKTIVKKIINQSNEIKIDNLAHEYEHSLEVQIPFIQYIYDNAVSIVPILMKKQDKTTAKTVGKILFDVLKKNKDILFLASSDFSHYEKIEDVHRKDIALIQSIKKLDIDEFYEKIQKLKISLCGYGCIGAIMVIAKCIGANNVDLLRYGTSGDLEQSDKMSVVGYSTIIFTL
ncbi:MAG: AmmeMemoRadiSam system protein B [Nitrososphaeraceae archaeon]